MKNEFNKVEYMKSQIGKSFSDNFSSTLRSKLVDVVEKKGKHVCITEECKSEYNKIKPKLKFKVNSVDYVYTCFVGV